MDFNLVNLSITIRSADARQLIDRLPLLGNEFAAACRQDSCRWPERECDPCPMRESCDWQLVFGQRLTSDPSALKRFQKPPLPFMFRFPFRQEPAENFSEIKCGLLVIGRAIACLELLLAGFRKILEPLGATVVQVGTRDYQGTIHPLVDILGVNYPENLVVMSINDLLESCVLTKSCLQIRLLSPLRMFEEGHLCDSFDFSRFAKSLLRRVSSLAYYYGGYESSWDYKELSRQADAVICMDNHFVIRKEQNRKMAGLTGCGTFRGDFNVLLPFLIAGLYVHVGKGATFGMGVYEFSEC